MRRAETPPPGTEFPLHHQLRVFICSCVLALDTDLNICGTELFVMRSSSPPSPPPPPPLK